MRKSEAEKSSADAEKKEVEMKADAGKVMKEGTDGEQTTEEKTDGREDVEKEAGEEVKAPRPMTLKELLILLKPFFWPEDGTDGVVTNRIRACSTWFCVIASRVCGVYSPFFIETATNELVAGDLTAAWLAIVGFALLRIGASMFKELQGTLYVKVKQQASVQLTLQTFVHVHNLSLGWHLSKKTGSVMKSVDRGVLAANTLVQWMFLYLVPSLAECAAVIILFFAKFRMWTIAVVITGGIFLYFAVTIKITVWRTKFREKQNKYDNDFHDKAQDSIVNFETVKYFTAEKYEANRYLTSVAKYESQVSNTQSSTYLLNFTQQLILQLTLLGALLLAAQGVRNGKMTLGAWVAVMSWILQIFQPLQFLGFVYSGIVQALIDVRNLTELLNEEPDIVDSKGATDIPYYAASLALRSGEDCLRERAPSGASDKNRDVEAAVPLKQGKVDLSAGVSVEFKEVGFHYPTQPVERGLKRVSFTLPAGTTTAVVGSTGAGKTTLSRLLFRFYDILEGSVYIDGQSIRESTQQSVRGMIGIVPQDTVLFNDTIAYNIRYGRQDASDEEIEVAAKSAQIMDFINALPQGWETIVGERGLKLSGGEKQRVAIARCLLKNPPIVVLDEATSALDTVTENSVQEALESLGQNRTVLIIAHRLSTIKNADQIIAMDNGEVKEVGTHDELFDREGGIYSKLWKMQQRQNGSESDLVALAAESVQPVVEAEAEAV